MIINYISQPPPSSILIVDDNAQNLQVVGKLLLDNNYNVEFAISGEATLEWLKNKNFDLILLDINMPVMSGFEVCEIIRSDKLLNEMPIIFLSSNTDREIILKGFEYGAQDYLTKPFDSRELLARVKTHITLKESREELKKLNIALEEKVKERTFELSETLIKLEAANAMLKDLDKAKADFLKMISHQIRTPLNGIVGPIQMLKENKESQIVKMVEIIDLSVKRLEKFSLNALLITQIKTEGEHIPKGNINLLELINKCLENKALSDQILYKNIHTEISLIPPDLKIYGNLKLLQTAINNVLDNAVQFSKELGTVYINNIISDDSVTIEIIDGGQGFPENMLTSINEQLSSTDLPINPNLGLGMNLVKLIMDFHNAKVEVMNNKENGSCVWLIMQIVKINQVKVQEIEVGC